MLFTDVPCGRKDCFANKCMFCQALWTRPRVDLMDCPFFKEKGEYEAELEVLKTKASKKEAKK